LTKNVTELTFEESSFLASQSRCTEPSFQTGRLLFPGVPRTLCGTERSNPRGRSERIMATAQAERVDPKTRRIATGQAGHLRNGRADRAYKLANPLDENFGLQIHLDMGWEKINGGKDGDKERVAGGRVDANGTVSFNGQVLIWLPKDESDAREADKRDIMKAREQKRNGPGGIDSVMDADGKLAQRMRDEA
jgi:hypothetical protein